MDSFPFSSIPTSSEWSVVRSPNLTIFFKTFFKKSIVNCAFFKNASLIVPFQKASLIVPFQKASLIVPFFQNASLIVPFSKGIVNCAFFKKASLFVICDFEFERRNSMLVLFFGRHKETPLRIDFDHNLKFGNSNKIWWKLTN